MRLGRMDPALQNPACTRADAAFFPLLIDLACSDSHASDTLTLTPEGIPWGFVGAVRPIVSSTLALL